MLTSFVPLATMKNTLLKPFSEGMAFEIVKILFRGKAFWSTTGMYPQEIVIALKEEMRVAEIKTVTAGVKKLSVERVIPKKTVAANAIPTTQWTRIDTVGKLQDI